MHLQNKELQRLLIVGFWIFTVVIAGGSDRTAYAAPWSLGKLSIQSGTVNNCPQGYSCKKFLVRCQGVTRNEDGSLAIALPQIKPRGLIIFFPGGGGKSWWTADSPEVKDFVEELRSMGFITVQVKWSGSGWLRSSPGNDAGIAHLACRPATVIQYIHDKHYLPLNLKSPVGTAGFSVVGSSGGASQITYSLSHYGLSNILDVVIPLGGPPHASLAKSCLNRSGEEEYWFPDRTRKFIDAGFGFLSGNGPCLTHNASYIPRWDAESVSTGGNDYHYPKTRVSFLIGEKDGIRHIAKDLLKKLRENDSPYITWKIVSNTGHEIMDTKEGRRAVRNSILATTSGSIKDEDE